MFTFGRSGSSACSGGKCRCYCQTSINPDGTCEHKDQNGFNLYKDNRYKDTMRKSNIDEMRANLQILIITKNYYEQI